MGDVNDASDVNDAVMLLRDIGSPSVIMYNNIVDSLCKNGRVNHAFGIYHEMTEKGVVSNNVTHMCLMKGLCGFGLRVQAKELLDDMLARRILLDFDTFNVVMSFLRYSRNGELNEANELFNEMRESCYLPDGCTYKTIIQGFLLHNEMSKAFHFIDKTRSNGFKIDAYTEALLLRFQSRGQLRHSSEKCYQFGHFTPSVARPNHVWNETWKFMKDDIEHCQRQQFNNPGDSTGRRFLLGTGTQPLLLLATKFVADRQWSEVNIQENKKYDAIRVTNSLVPFLPAIIVCSIAVVSSSLNVGKAGSMVHSGACIATLTCQGITAGITAAFHAPVGGVLFCF
ncbi:putative pentatricopeptide repeat-containing protein [Tanacetum coccineum]